jgi:hypothetical protein
MPLMPFATDCLRNLSENRRGWLAPRQAARLSCVFCVMGGGKIRPELRFSFLADWQVKSWH